jgi:L,D-transpeptidase catalytic domain
MSNTAAPLLTLASEQPASRPRHLTWAALGLFVAPIFAAGCASAPAAPPVPPEPAPALEASSPAPSVAPVQQAETPVPEPTEVATETPPAPEPPEPVTPPAPTEPQLYATSGLARIYEKPDRDAPVIGAMRAGQSVTLVTTELAKHHTVRRLYQCNTGWYEVKPRGWVCVGGPGHGTLDGDDPTVVAARAVLPDLNQDYPYKFGVSVGTPQYLRIPTEAEQRQAEPDLERYLQNMPAADDSKGGAINITPAGRPAPEDFMKHLAYAKPKLTHEQAAYDGYKIAWAHEFDANGRTWLLTPDMTLVPKDKVRQKPLPTLKGVDLKKHPNTQLPLAFFWLDDSFKYRQGEDGKLYPTEEMYKRHDFVEATMNQSKGPGGIYWQMKDGDWVKYHDVTMIRARPQRPAGVGPDEKWVEVRVTWGYLIAYEGDRPVYVTAMSPGVDGIANAKHSTARGKHNVDWKMYSGDMSGRDKGKDWYVDEVPWVQYYKGNYAFHGAWWHNDFGRPKSHGCVNLAPADARFLFQWMDPVIPQGWYAVSVYYPHVMGTRIYIRH